MVYLQVTFQLERETDVRVTVGHSDTFANPRGCHSNRRPLYSDKRLQWHPLKSEILKNRGRYHKIVLGHHSP